MLKRFSYQ